MPEEPACSRRGATRRHSPPRAANNRAANKGPVGPACFLPPVRLLSFQAAAAGRRGTGDIMLCNIEAASAAFIALALTGTPAHAQPAPPAPSAPLPPTATLALPTPGPADP